MTTDHALLAQLNSIFQLIDPVPSDVLDLAYNSLTWRNPDAALAQLVADSSDQMPATTRSRKENDPPRLLSFQSEECTVEVEVANTGEGRRLLGQLVPPGIAEIQVRWADGAVNLSSDDLGYFRVEDVPATQISISCRRPTDDRPTVTSWLTI